MSKATILGLAWRFALHVLTGLALFGTIAVAAVQITFLVSWMERRGVPSFAIMATQGLEYLVFVADSVLFVIFILRTAALFGSSLWNAEVST